MNFSATVPEGHSSICLRIERKFPQIVRASQYAESWDQGRADVSGNATARAMGPRHAVDACAVGFNQITISADLVLYEDASCFSVTATILAWTPMFTLPNGSTICALPTEARWKVRMEARWTACRPWMHRTR